MIKKISLNLIHCFLPLCFLVLSELHSKSYALEKPGDFFKLHCPDSSITESKNRPYWWPDVERAFQYAHFGTLEYGSMEMSLNHVWPYKYIWTALEQRLQEAFNYDKNNNDRNGNDPNIDNYQFVEEYIERIFEYDNEAIVYVPPRVDKDGLLINSNIVFDFTVPPSVRNWLKHYVKPGWGTCYLINNLEQTQYPPSLIELNESYKLEAIVNLGQINYAKEWVDGQFNKDQQILNCYYTEMLLRCVNSAPANLRYGDRSMNSGIQDSLDPMLNYHTLMTAKDSKWFWEARDTEFTTEVENFKPDNGEMGYYVKSSTGYYEKEVCKKSYYVRCPIDNYDCTDRPREE